MYPFNWPLSMFLASVGVPLLIKVKVVFDPEANVYVATSPNVRGLAVEADSLDEVRKQVEIVLPELLEINHLVDAKHNTQHTRLQFNTELSPA